MPKEAQSKTIGGRLIQVQPLPAFAAISLLTRISKVVGSAIGPAFGALVKSGDRLGDVDLSEHFARLFSVLSPEDTESIARALLQGAVIDPHGKTRILLDVADAEFAGETLTLLKVAYFAFEVNYGDFSAFVLGLLNEARRKQSEEKSSPASSGSPKNGVSGA